MKVEFFNCLMYETNFLLMESNVSEHSEQIQIEFKSVP